jgi:hypothetical protein
VEKTPYQALNTFESRKGFSGGGELLEVGRRLGCPVTIKPDESMGDMRTLVRTGRRLVVRMTAN